MKINKKNIGVLLASGAIVAGSFTSCKKGEEDPFLSLKSRKGRLTGKWEVKSWKYTSDGQEIDLIEGRSSSGYSVSFSKEIDFDKKGDFDMETTVTYTYGGQTQSSSYVQKGEWEFNDDKSEIKLDFDEAGTSDAEWELIRLSNKEIKAEFVDGGDKTTIEMEKIK